MHSLFGSVSHSTICVIYFSFKLSPAQNDLLDNHKYYYELCKKRSRKAEMISTASLDMAKSNLRESTPMDDTNVALSATVPFSVATYSQMNEDKKLCGAEFDDVRTLSECLKKYMYFLEYHSCEESKTGTYVCFIRIWRLAPR
jgi:hypothetical protein